MQLEVTNIVVSYGKHRSEDSQVLRGLSLSYSTPGILSLLGGNGCGKSTLLKTLIGYLQPRSGNIMIDGIPLGNMSVQERAQKIAYVPQSYEPCFPYTCFEVALFGRTAHVQFGRAPDKTDEERAYEALRKIGIEKLAKKRYTEISGGERQLVMLASALAQQPQLLLLDEPTSHLDFGNQYRFLETIKEVNNNNTGVIMTTHYPDHPLILGGESAVMEGGVLTLQGQSTEILTEEVLSNLYKRKILVREIEGKRRVLV